jgi:hypothetical protein
MQCDNNHLGGHPHGPPITIRGGGDPAVKTMASKPLCRMPVSMTGKSEQIEMIMAASSHRVKLGIG